MVGLGPATYVLKRHPTQKEAWIPGTSPGMTS
jgi:hypothetical protein